MSERNTPEAPPSDPQEGYWTYAALTIGFNELAKLHTVLGEKVYFRLLREAAQEKFVESGGNRFITVEDGILTIEVPGGPPHVVFREQDIELMREVVAKHDAEKGASK